MNIPYADGIVPRAVVKNWDDQCAPALRESVIADYDSIRALRFKKTAPAELEVQKLYLATAGAPGSGKSYILENELQHGDDARYATAVKVDPDRYVMRNMKTYSSALENARSSNDAQPGEAAYTAARPGSNSIASRLLNEAIATGRHVAHGTTLTTPHAGEILDALGDRGYERHLLIVGAPDSFRKQAVDNRNTVEDFHQVTPDDFISKGKAATMRTADWIAHTDRASLFWNDDLQQSPRLAAEFTPNAGMRIHDARAYDAYVQNYHTQRDLLLAEGKAVSTWDRCAAQYRADV